MRPPRFWRWLMERVTVRVDRRFVIADLDEGFEQRCTGAGDGGRSARRWYRRQVLASLWPGARDRWARRRFFLLDSLVNDTWLAMRGLAREPVVGTLTVVSLAIGITAVTTVFSAVDAFLLRSPSASIREPGRLVSVFTSSSDGAYERTSYPDFLDIRQQASTMPDLALSRLGFMRLGAEADKQTATVEIVSGNYFSLLGVSPNPGRGFRVDETRVGAAERVAIISNRLWRERFAADPDIAGRTLRLDGHDFVVIGVAPADLISRFLALRIDAWVPLGIPGGTFRSNERTLAERRYRGYNMLGRLADDADHESAHAEMAVIAERLAAQYGEDWLDQRRQPLRLTVVAERAARVPPDAYAALLAVTVVVLVGALLVLAIGCSNVAGVLLARNERRHREMAVRRALGASRRRLVGMLLVENLLLALAAGGLGLAGARWALTRFDTVALPLGGVVMSFDLRADHRALLFALAVSALTSLAFGLGPSLRSTGRSGGEALRSATATASRARSRLRGAVVATQVAGAVAFVVGSTTATRSFAELAAIDWGVQPDRIAIASIDVPQEIPLAGFEAWYRETIAELEADPAVASAHVSRVVESSAFSNTALAAVEVPGYDRGEAESMTFPYNAVSSGYMEALGIRLLRGRNFAAGDDGAAVPVAIVNETFARRFWPAGDAIGQRIALAAPRDEEQPAGPPREHEVVGVAADGLYEGIEGANTMFFWVPIGQRPARSVVLALRARDDPATVMPLLQAQVERTRTDVAAIPPQRFRDLIDFQFSFVRLLGKVLAACGAFGLFLACFGIYGVLSYALTQRLRELAIRQAMGASPTRIATTLLSQAARLTAIGLVLGLAIVLPLVALLRADMPGMQPIEPTAVLIGLAMLVAAALAAAALPARRATGIDPAAALRHE